MSHDANGDAKMSDDTSGSVQQSPARSSAIADTAAQHVPTRQPDYVEEVVQILKTAFPLLILSMETMVDNISSRFRASSDEEIYRLTCVLLADAIQASVLVPFTRASRPNPTLPQHLGQRLSVNDDGQLWPQTIATIQRFSASLTGPIRVSCG